jgi:hypothetical protein
MPPLPALDRNGLAPFAAAAAGGGRWRPARFSERGVLLPFTTPFLLGGRMRRTERGGAELVLAHPAGSDGIYVLPWSAMANFCAPTLHDRALWERATAALPELSPAAARRAARAVAAAGYAGRDAARAAAAAEAAREASVTALHYGLLLDLLRRIEPAGAGTGAAAPPSPSAPESPAGVERRVLSALGRLREEGGPSPAAAMAALGEIASALEGCGLRSEAAGEGGPARLPRLVAGLAAMAAEMEAAAAVAAARAPDDARRSGLRLLAESAGLAARCGQAALDAAHALLDDPWALLRRWPEEGRNILHVLSRPEWLLDGWDAVRALWHDGGVGTGTAALHDMALPVPAMPTEAGAWAGPDAAERSEALREGLRLWRRAALPRSAEASATAAVAAVAGRIADLTARNESLRALCA